MVLLTAGLMALGALVIISAAHVVLDRRTGTAADDVLDRRVTGVVAATRTGPDGEPVTADALLGAGTVVYDEAGEPVGGSVPPSLAGTYADLAQVDSERHVQISESYRVVARPFERPGGAAGVVVAAERLSPYERTEGDVLWTTMLAGALLVLLAAVLAGWVTRRSLAPVAEMARTADDWSEHDLSRRFDLGPADDELATLGHTLDSLLERVAVAIRSEQRLTSELAHEVRTPLTGVLGLTELALARDDLPDDLREDLAEIRSAALRMGDTVTGLLTLARSESFGRDDSALLTDVVAESLATVGAEPGRVTVLVAPGLRATLPPSLAVRTLAPVLANALATGTEVRVDAAAGGPWVEVGIEDDGPGVDPAIVDTVFDPGVTRRAGGSGLGLALARRIARSAGGDVLLAQPSGPTRFVVRLPRG
jgi:two-component system, OmpR family, sensor kinase